MGTGKKEKQTPGHIWGDVGSGQIPRMNNSYLWGSRRNLSLGCPLIMIPMHLDFLLHFRHVYLPFLTGVLILPSCDLIVLNDGSLGIYLFPEVHHCVFKVIHLLVQGRDIYPGCASQKIFKSARMQEVIRKRKLT